MHHAVMAPLRLVHGCTFNDPDTNLSDEDLLIKTGAMPPVVQLRMLRVLFFLRICQRAPDVLLQWLLASLADPASWMSTVVAHLKHIVVHAPVLENCRGWSISQWCGCSRGEGKSLKMSVVKAFNSLTVAGWMTSKTQISDIRLWPCTCCGQIEQSSQALSVHMARSHGIKTEVRRYAWSSQCEACLCKCTHA